MIRLSRRADRDFGRAPFLLAIGSPVFMTIVVAVAALLVGLLMRGQKDEIILVFGINAILVVALQVFVGNTGIVSFGHMAFMAVGAYAAGIVSLPVQPKAALLPDLPGWLQGFAWPFFPSLLAAGAAAAVVAAVLGPAIVRLTGPAAAVVTLGLLVIVNQVLRHAKEFTRGTQTFSGVPKTTTFTWVFGALIAAVLVAALFKWSAAGLKSKMTRDDPLAAETCGVNVTMARLVPFVLSAALTGLAGGLWAHYLTAFQANSFYIAQAVPVIAMLILGGATSITGAMVGALLISIWAEFARFLEAGFSLGSVHLVAPRDLSNLALGVALIVLLPRRPQGIAGPRELMLSVTARPIRHDRLKVDEGTGRGESSDRPGPVM